MRSASRMILEEKDSGFMDTLGSAASSVGRALTSNVPGLDHLPSVVKPVKTIAANTKPAGRPTANFQKAYRAA